LFSASDRSPAHRPDFSGLPLARSCSFSIHCGRGLSISRMHLRELRIHGFKSFADPTQLSLEPGVTAIVGPNGCGKSNIADAIRWVLGEQSSKSLRAGAMQDVIFQGTTSRKPLNLSEVSLVFTDCEAQLGTAFKEVEVTRRVT